MSNVSQAQVEEVLKGYIDPHLEKDLVSTKAVKNIAVDGDKVKVDVVLGYPANGFQDQLAADLKQHIEAVEGVSSADVSVDWKVQAHAVQKNLNAIEGVKNIEPMSADIYRYLNFHLLPEYQDVANTVKVELV